MDSTKRMALESLLGRFPFDVGAADLLRSLYLFSFYNAPQSLYRYRSCGNAYSFNDIENGVMTFSSPLSFEDQEDAAIRDAGLADQVAGMMVEGEDDVLDFIAGVLDRWDGCADADAAACLKDSGKRFSQMGKASRRQETRKALSELKTFLGDSGAMDAFRKTCRVVCLCENGNSRHMWNAYADGGSGYLIEYDTSKLFKIDGDRKQTHLILPVIYTDELPDTLLLACLPFFQEPLERLCGKDAFEGILALNMVRALFFKLREAFSLEEEWRMSIPIAESEIQQPFVTREIVPSRLVAGPNMAERDRARLYECARAGGIFVHDWNEFSDGVW